MSFPTARHADHRAPLRVLAIAIVFTLGATLALPSPATAQVTASLSGTVADLEGGNLSGAHVSAKKQVGGNVHEVVETTTDEAGAYAFSGLSAGAWEVTARLDGYRTNVTTVDLGVNQAATHDIALQSILASYLVGTVVSQENETPLAGVHVRVEGYSNGAGGTRETTTDADGTFQVKLFNQENRITLSKSGYGKQHDWLYSPGGNVERTYSMYEVPPQTATVTGKVVDQNGDPIKAYVELHPDHNGDCCVAYAEDAPASDDPAATMPSPMPYPYYDNYNSTETADDGTFTMKAFPGNVVVAANRAGYLVASEHITLTEGATETIEFTLVKLPERTVTVQGTVIDRATGEPLPGASVNVQVPGAGDYQWAQTDEDGRYSVLVRPGYTILEIAYWGPVHYAEDVVYAAEAGEADGGGSNSSGASTGMATRIRAPDGPQKQYFPVSQVFTTAANDEKTVKVLLTPKPEPTGTVLGYVVDDATDTAIAGARVTLQNHETGDWGEAITDGNGSYRFKTNGGYHTVWVYADGYLPFSTNVVVEDDGATRADYLIHAGEHANAGWWDPSGQYGGSGPYPMSVSEESAASYDGGSGAPTKAGASEAAARASPSGDRGLAGSGGDLPAYDPDDAERTFGAAATADAPGVAPLVLVMVLGLLAVAAGLRGGRRA